MIEKFIVAAMALALFTGMYSAMEKQADINDNIYKRMEVPK